MYVEHHTSSVRRRDVWCDSVLGRVWEGTCMFITTPKHSTDVFLMTKQWLWGCAFMCGGWTKAQVYQFNISLLKESSGNATHTIIYFRLNTHRSFFSSLFLEHTHSQKGEVQGEGHRQKIFEKEIQHLLSLFSSDIDIHLFALFKNVLFKRMWCTKNLKKRQTCLWNKTFFFTKKKKEKKKSWVLIEVQQCNSAGLSHSDLIKFKERGYLHFWIQRVHSNGMVCLFHLFQQQSEWNLFKRLFSESGY